ncbi:MAG: Asp-tRNA(Asn)/Glu-tRNA(Gln) amidotransferase subunit GatC [bacterium]
MVTENDIKHLADLSRIEITDDEAKHLTKEVDSILGYVGQIQDIQGDIKNTSPLLRNVFREDVATNKPNEYTDDLLNNAPQTEGRYFKVKKIL